MIPSYLQQQIQFSWLALVSEKVLPLTIVRRHKQKGIRNLFSNSSTDPRIKQGNFFTLFPPFPHENDLPKAAAPTDCAFFNGYDIVDMEGSTGAKGKNVIPLLGEINLKAQTSNVKRLLYCFKDVKHVTIEDEFKLSEYLNSHSVNPNLKEYTTAIKDGELYVTTEVLQTTEFEVYDIEKSSTGMSVDASDATKMASLAASLKTDNESTARIYHPAGKPVTFALRIAKIFYRPKEDMYSLRPENFQVVKNGRSSLSYLSVENFPILDLD